MSTPERILVVDDDPALRELLHAYLSDTGFVVDLAEDGTAMRITMAQERPDAIVLDLMMPGENGLSITQELRRPGSAYSRLPVLMISARGEEIDRVVGLEMGVDDYLAKPFSPRELLARLRALLRRSRTTPPSAGQAESKRIVWGPYQLDVDGHRLLCQGVEVEISNAEFALLKVLVEHPNRVLSRDLLMDLLKGYEWDPNDRTIDIRVGRLRRKIEPDPAHPVYIRTIRGEGYLFNPRGGEP